MSNAPGLLCRSIALPFADAVAAAEMAIASGGAEIIAKIDHSMAAANAGLHLRPTTLLMFGNSAGGTRLMQVRPNSAIDLPMKLLIVAGNGGEVRAVGEDPAWIVERHGSADGLADIIAGMSRLMQLVLDLTASPSPTVRTRQDAPETSIKTA